MKSTLVNDIFPQIHAKYFNTPRTAYSVRAARRSRNSSPRKIAAERGIRSVLRLAKEEEEGEVDEEEEKKREKNEVEKRRIFHSGRRIV